MQHLRNRTTGTLGVLLSGALLLSACGGDAGSEDSGSDSATGS